MCFPFARKRGEVSPDCFLECLRQLLSEGFREEDSEAASYSGHHAHDEHRGGQPVDLGKSKNIY